MPWRTGIRWSLLLLLGAAVGSLSVYSIHPAEASDGCPASGSPFNVFYQNGTGGRGVRTANPGMGIYNGDVSCTRVSSIFVYSADGVNFVEAGWYEDPTNTYFCLDDTSGPPKRLAYVRFSGMRDCKHFPGTLSEADSPDEFSIFDDNQNGIWQFHHNGSKYWESPDTGSFNSGVQQDNGERTNVHNTSHAEFRGMQKRDSSQTWVNWSGVFLGGDDDSGAKGCFYSNTHQAVKLDGTAC